MRPSEISRRRFLRRATGAAGGAALAAAALPHAVASAPPTATATDIVPLGRTGLRISRLGMGTGSIGGRIQRELGQDAFTRLLRHGYDRGLTYIDTADSYGTHGMVRQAIRGLPREKLFIQTKLPGLPEKPAEEIDRMLGELGVDHVDSLLVHCASTPGWDTERAAVIDAVRRAQEAGKARVIGVSCHSLPALTLATRLDWVQVHLVRVNPQGAYMDTPEPTWNAKSDDRNVGPVLERLRVMRARGRGVIGMKLIGNGDFQKPEDRERSIRFAMRPGLLDAAVIGFKSPAEIDEAIERANRALARTATGVAATARSQIDEPGRRARPTSQVRPPAARWIRAPAMSGTRRT